MACQTPYRDDSAQVLLFKIASCIEAGGGGGGVAGVASFNGRTGVVTLTAADVSTALGCTPLCEADGDARYVLKAGDTMTGSLNIANSAILVASDPALDITQTWNNAAVTFTGLNSNITNTASNTNSNLFNFQVDGVDRFNFTPGGSLRAVRQDASDSGMNFFLRKRGNAGGATNALASDATIGTVAYSGWNGAAFVTGSRISGLASEVWTGIANGSRIDLYTTPLGSTTEQITLRLSHTGQSQFLDGTAALPALTFQSDPDTGIYRIGANSLGISTGGVLRLTVDGTSTTFAGTLLIPDGTAALPGLAFSADTNTGIYRIGADILGFSTAGTARWQIDASGHLLATTTNSFDIGAFAGNRPRRGWFGTQVTAPTITANSVFATDTGGLLDFGGETRVRAPASGVLKLSNNGETDFGRLQFGGTTSSFPSIKRSAATLQFRLADDSAFADIATAGIVMSTAAPLSITSGANQRCGDAVLVAGTVTVANTTVTANTRVFLTRKVVGGTIGFAVTYTLIAATSFTITSDNVLDTSTYSYLLIEVP